MALHDNTKLICVVYSGLVKSSNNALWRYKKNGKGVNRFYYNQHDKDVIIKGRRGFIIKYDKSIYHIKGLKNFSHIGRFKGYIVYFTDKADSFPIELLNNNGYIIKKFLIIMDSSYFPLGSNDRKLMIEDLESFDKYLSKNINLKKLEATYYSKSKSSVNIFSVINLVRRSTRIRILFHNLVRHPYSYLIKNYFKCINPKRKDNKAIKLSLMKPGVKRYSFVKRVNYNTEENRLMKDISLNIINLAFRSIKYMSQKQNINQPRILFIKSLKHLSSYLIYINHMTFLKYVNGNIEHIPLKLPYLRIYFLIYKEYKRLFNNKLYIPNIKNIHYLMDYKYTYSIKSTSELYELWTFVFILRNLLHFGFFIYKIEDYNGLTTLVAFLNHGLRKGTVFYLKSKSGIYLKVTYNRSIDYDINSPIYIFNSNVYNLHKFNNIHNINNNDKREEKENDLHDRPDIRIDIYRNRLYEGSIILDAKCRNEKFVNKERRDIHQILSYQYYANYKSNIIKNYPTYFQLMHLNPIQHVFVLYSGNPCQSQNDIFGIKYIRLVPKSHQKGYKEKFLIDIINNCDRVITLLNEKLD